MMSYLHICTKRLLELLTVVNVKGSDWWSKCPLITMHRNEAKNILTWLHNKSVNALSLTDQFGLWDLNYFSNQAAFSEFIIDVEFFNSHRRLLYSEVKCVWLWCILIVSMLDCQHWRSRKLKSLPVQTFV